MEGGALVTKNPGIPAMHQTAAAQRMQPKMFKDPAVPEMRIGNLRDRGGAVLPAAIPNASQFDGKRMRKAIHRKTIDYNPTIIRYLEDRVFQRDYRDRPAIQPDSLYASQLLPPSALLDKPMNCVTTKFVRTSTNKFRCPIFCLTWTPEGRRLVTGASSGEFTLWNGLTFNFETILQAHDSSVRAMRWSHNDLWMVTADHAGYIKYWQSNMNNVKMYQGHKEAIRGISFSPTDSKFATCSDDGTVRIWDFMRCHEEKILRGHGADVKCVDWHPQKSLVASGSKDNQQPVKLWDPRTGNSLATLHAHKHTVMDLSWNQNGHWLLTASRDHLLKLFDIRNLKTELQTFKGHKKEATSIAWHPIHESLFATGGSDGSLMFWLVGCDREVGSMEEAHDGMVWSLGWHPLGHILVSGSNDHSTKFWTRNRPGDEMRDRYNLNNLPAGVEQELLEYNQEPQLMPNLPGMGLEHGLPDHLQAKAEDTDFEELPNIPGLDWNMDSPFFKQLDINRLPQKKIPFAKPIPKSFEQAWLGNKPMMPITATSKEDKKGPQIVQQQQKPPGGDGNKGSNGGIPGLPPGVTPEALSILLGVNPGAIPPAALMGMLSSAAQLQQSGLLAIQQQALLLQQQAVMSQQALQQQQNAGGPLRHGMQQQHKQGESNQQMQSGMLPHPASGMQQQIGGVLQQQMPGPMQQQQGMPLRPPMQPSQKAQLQNLQAMGMRPMMPPAANQFRPPMPGQGQQQQQQLQPEGVHQPGQMGHNQLRPAGPSQFGQPRQQFKPVQQQIGGQQLPGGQSIMDQDLRRSAGPGPTTPSSTPQQPAPSALDIDFRRQEASATVEQFGSEGDLDFRQAGRGMGPGRFPPRGRGGRGGGSSNVPHNHSGQFQDNDMRQQQQYFGGDRGMGRGGGGYADDGYGDQYLEDQYGDYDARASSGGGSGGGGVGGRDKDERYLPVGGAGADGGYPMQGGGGYQGGYQERQGAGPARDRNHLDEHQVRKRPWEEGPGSGPRGRLQDPRMAAGARRGVGVYNGPAGPLEARRGGGGRGSRGGGGFRGGW